MSQPETDHEFRERVLRAATPSDRPRIELAIGAELDAFGRKHSVFRYGVPLEDDDDTRNARWLADQVQEEIHRLLTDPASVPWLPDGPSEGPGLTAIGADLGVRRMQSDEANGVWDPWLGAYVESDAQFRERVLADIRARATATHP